MWGRVHKHISDWLNTIERDRDQAAKVGRADEGFSVRLYPAYRRL